MSGAQDIGLLMASPQARGLFHRAILESGPVVSIGAFGYQSRVDAERAGAEFGRGIGRNDVAELRAVPADELLADAARLQLRTAPDIDGWVLEEEPGATFAAGRAAPIPLLVGSNAREFTFHGTPDELRAQIRENFGELAPRALRLYGVGDGQTAPAADPVLGDVGTQFVTDVTFRGSASLLALWHSAAGRPAWRYQFSRTPIGHEAAGAAHSAELPYVFGEMVPNELGADYNAADRRLSSAMQGYWVNFATTGDPNGKGLAIWPRYDPEKRGYVEFTADGPRAEAGLRREFIDLFRARYEQLRLR